MTDHGIQRRITAFWDIVAPSYESENVAAVGTADYEHWREVLKALLPGAPARVLDLGTGTGFVARIAVAIGHQVTAIDLSEGMLRAAAAHEAGATITYAVGDAIAPHFPPESFDAVVSRSLIWTLREPERALATGMSSWHRAGE